MGAAEFIKGAGGSLVSRNILDRCGNIKWLNREEPVNPADNGWRILSDVDTDEFLSDPDNMAVVDFNAMCGMEPALIGIYSALNTKPAVLDKANPHRTGLEIRETFRFC